jgi:hypothetical protein
MANLHVTIIQIDNLNVKYDFYTAYNLVLYLGSFAPAVGGDAQQG